MRASSHFPRRSGSPNRRPSSCSTKSWPDRPRTTPGSRTSTAVTFRRPYGPGAGDGSPRRRAVRARPEATPRRPPRPQGSHPMTVVAATTGPGPAIGSRNARDRHDSVSLDRSVAGWGTVELCHGPCRACRFSRTNSSHRGFAQPRPPPGPDRRGSEPGGERPPGGRLDASQRLDGEAERPPSHLGDPLHGRRPGRYRTASRRPFKSSLPPPPALTRAHRSSCQTLVTPSSKPSWYRATRSSSQKKPYPCRGRRADRGRNHALPAWHSRCRPGERINAAVIDYLRSGAHAAWSCPIAASRPSCR